jgi:hypothetical protein
MTKSRARPVCTPELAREIYRRLMDGETLRKICKGDDMPGYCTVPPQIAEQATLDLVGAG